MCSLLEVGEESGVTLAFENGGVAGRREGHEDHEFPEGGVGGAAVMDYFTLSALEGKKGKENSKEKGKEIGGEKRERQTVRPRKTPFRLHGHTIRRMQPANRQRRIMRDSGDGRIRHNRGRKKLAILRR